MKLNQLTKTINPSPTLALNQKAKRLAKEGKNIVNLTAGEPDFATPDVIVQAALDAMKSAKTFYTATEGIIELREAILSFEKPFYKKDFGIENIMVTPGAKQAIFNFCYSLLEPGDEVIMFAPYWVSYSEMVSMCLAKPVIIQTRMEDGFEPDLNLVKDAINSKTKLLIFNSPSNPSGVVYSPAFISKLSDLLNQHEHINVLCDDIYTRLYYESEDQTLLAKSFDLSRLAIVSGVSKTFAMTGWRIGWIITDRSLIQGMTAVQSQMVSNPCSISQWASLCALTKASKEAKQMFDTFLQRRNWVVERVQKIKGLSFVKPKGAFYMFVKLPQVSDVSDTKFCEIMLDEYGLALVPGSAFGMDGFVRFSFASSKDNLIRGLDLLESGVKKVTQ